MVDEAKKPKLVGNLIRSRRESLGLSQRALGQLFTPAVTTQFISNIERGVTPLPPVHVGTLAKALQMPESDITSLMEREYTFKLSERLGRPGGEASAGNPSGAALPISNADYAFMRSLYDAYQRADQKTKDAFANVAVNLLKVPGSGSGMGSVGSR
jgi:transcriptional regulator with XRE-family HTH domain